MYQWYNSTCAGISGTFDESGNAKGKTESPTTF